MYIISLANKLSFSHPRKYLYIKRCII